MGIDYKKWTGKISACKKHIPNCMCCNINNNYIAILPGEFKGVIEDISHLKIIKEDEFGGKIAVCTKQCAINDYKPLDCKSFPFFPRVVGNKIVFYHSKRCCLPVAELKNHHRDVLNIWEKLITNPNILKWINTVEMPDSYMYQIEK